MKEFEFIKLMTLEFGGGISGIGDDAALFDDTHIITNDMLIENTHFLSTTPIEYVINKLFTSNVSDIAAMGGKAKYALLSIATDNELKLDKILPVLKTLCERYNIKIIGGDTSSNTFGLVLSMTLIGSKPKNLLTRSKATPGDLLFLSRPIGKAKISLETELGLSQYNCDPYYHYKLEAEDKLGEILGTITDVTSCIDISDGLGRDAAHISRMSGVKVVIYDNYLPYAYLGKFHINKQNYILTSGEEYALLFTISKNVIEDVIPKIVSASGCNDIILVGKIEQGSGTFLKCENGMMKDISTAGYEHFNKNR